MKSKGISLIVLVITIIIMIILATAIILSLTKTGIIGNSTEAVFKSDIKNYINGLEEYKGDLEIKNKMIPNVILNYVGAGDTKGTIKEVFPDMENKYAKNFQILDGRLTYIGGSNKEIEWARDMGVSLLPFELSSDGKTILSTRDFVGINGNFVIPEYIEAIAPNAFYKNTKITEIDFSKNNKITEIPANAFNSCSNLRKIIFSNNIKKIGGAAFRSCTSLNDVIIPDDLEVIESTAFYSCSSLTNFSFSNNKKITDIYSDTFALTALTTITIPDSVRNIGTSAFNSNVNLTTVSIGANVSNISNNVFGNCTNLVNINVSDKNIKYESYDGCLYTKGLSNLVQVPAGKTEINISNIANTIGSSAFSGANKLTTINIPDNISIMDNPSFSECVLLTTININTSNPKYMVVDKVVYEKDSSGNPIKAIDCVKNIANIVIPSTVTEIDKSAFKNTNLVSIDMSSSLVKNIGKEAFITCRSLQTVKFYENLETIEDLAFYNCNVLNNINIPASVTKLDARAFCGSSNLKNFSIDVNNPIYMYKNGAIYSKDGKNMVALLNVHTEFTIPETVETLGAHSCSYAFDLRKITIPSSVKSIGAGCFKYDTALTTITIPSTVSIIKADTFSSCSNLKEIIIKKPNNTISGAPWGAPYGITAIKWQP